MEIKKYLIGIIKSKNDALSNNFKACHAGWKYTKWAVNLVALKESLIYKFDLYRLSDICERNKNICKGY
jgi:hypothetical protein